MDHYLCFSFLFIIEASRQIVLSMRMRLIGVADGRIATIVSLSFSSQCLIIVVNKNK